MAGNYFQAIKQNEKVLPDALDYFNNELIQAKEEVKFDGKMISKCVSELSSNFYTRLEQLQELEAILKHFEIKLAQRKSEAYKDLQNNTGRALTSSDLKMYIDGKPEIVAIQQIINEIALVRNKYLGLTKAFETANFQLSNLSKLYIANADSIKL